MGRKKSLSFAVMLSLLAFSAATLLVATFGGTPTDAASPYRPVNVSPANEATEVALTPTLQSSAFSDHDARDTHAASHWQITATTGRYFSSIFDSDVDTLNLTQIAVPTGTLRADTKYYWRVRHQDSHEDWSRWSIETSFTTLATPPNSPPGQPSNMSPADVATGISLTPTLQSSAFSDPGGTHAASQWQVRTISGYYTSPVYDGVTHAPYLTSTVFPSGRLSYSTTYYWHVRYQDNDGAWSAYSRETSFTTSPPSPVANFSAETTALLAGESVLFTDSSTGSIASWIWNFGDGTAPVTWTIRPTDGKVSHTYATAGTYTVTLRVTDAKGDSTIEMKAGYIVVGSGATFHDISLQGGTIQTADGRIAATFPPNAVSRDATLVILEMSPSTAPKAPKGYSIGSSCFALEATDTSGTAITSFSGAVTVTVRYSDEDMAAAGDNPEDLVLAYYNEATGEWATLETTRDTAKGILSVTTTHLSTWSILVKTSSDGLVSWIQIVIGIVATLVAGVVIWKSVSFRQPDQVPSRGQNPEGAHLD